MSYFRYSLILFESIWNGIPLYSEHSLHNSCFYGPDLCGRPFMYGWHGPLRLILGRKAGSVSSYKSMVGLQYESEERVSGMLLCTVAPLGPGCSAAGSLLSCGPASREHMVVPSLWNIRPWWDTALCSINVAAKNSVKCFMDSWFSYINATGPKPANMWGPFLAFVSRLLVWASAFMLLVPEGLTWKTNEYLYVISLYKFSLNQHPSGWQWVTVAAILCHPFFKWRSSNL